MGIIYGGENHSNGSLGPKTRTQVLKRSATIPDQKTYPGKKPGSENGSSPEYVSWPKYGSRSEKESRPENRSRPEQITGPDKLGYRCHIHIPIMFQMHRPQRTVSGGGVPYRGRNRMSPQTSSDEESGKQRLKTHQELEILKTLELQELLGSLG